MSDTEQREWSKRELKELIQDIANDVALDVIGEHDFSASIQAWMDDDNVVDYISNEDLDDGMEDAIKNSENVSTATLLRAMIQEELKVFFEKMMDQAQAQVAGQ